MPRARKVVISLIQGGARSSDIEENKAWNLERIDEAARGRPDFIVFDELSTTPYFPSGHRRLERCFEWAETIPGPFTRAVGRKAREYGCTVVVPLFERSGVDGRYYNSAALVGPDGKTIAGTMPDGSRVDRYAKVHIPNVRTKEGPLDETNYFSPGPGFPVFDTPKAKVGIAICYDRRFPESCRSLAIQGAEIIFVPANFPERSVLSVETAASEARTRAFENRVFLASCNKAGSEVFEGLETKFVGRSLVASPDGGLVGEPAPADAPAILRVEVDVSRIESANEMFPLLKDRAPEKYVTE